MAQLTDAALTQARDHVARIAKRVESAVEVRLARVDALFGRAS